MGSPKQDRRQFLNLTLNAALFPLIPDRGIQDKKGYTFLFQGDSITDGNRTRNKDWNHVMGHGFAYMISGRLWADHPRHEFQFYNRGISGNKIPDLEKRWQADTLDLKPDLLSILIGINDVSAFISGDQAMSAEAYEKGYRDLLKKTVEELPGIQLVLCEPFILKVGWIAEKWDIYQTEVQKRQRIVSKLAGEFNAIFIGFQKTFDDALDKAPAEYWVWDGIHPMPAGHELMAREWIRAVSKKLKFIR